MTQGDDDPWPPDDIHAMIIEMRANETSCHWMRAWQYAYLHACILLRKIRIPDGAEDIGQWVLLILARPGKLESFVAQHRAKDDAHPPRKAFLSLLRKITKGVCLNRLRYHHRRIQPQSLSAIKPAMQDEDVGSATVELDPPDPTENVEDRANTNDLIQALRKKLEDAAQADPWKKAQIMRALDRILGGMSPEEIAQQTGRTPAQVRSDTHQVRKLLRKRIERYEQGDDPPEQPNPPKPSKGPKQSQKPRQPKQPKRRRWQSRQEKSNEE